MREKIIFSGFGGQGIMFTGKLLAYAASFENKFVTWLPSYGAEVRGGTAFCMDIISDKEIASPLIKTPTACMVMNEPSFLKYKDILPKGALFIINSSMAESSANLKGAEVVNIPMTEIATKLGNQKVSNMVGLGYYIARKKPVSKETILKCFKLGVKPELYEINKMALETGMKWKK